MRNPLSLLCFVAAFAACSGERVGVVSGPPLTIDRGDAGALSPTVDAGSPIRPVSARFVPLLPDGEKLVLGPCRAALLVVVEGAAIFGGKALENGDTGLSTGPGTYFLAGAGTAFSLEIETPPPCETRAEAGPPRVIRGREEHYEIGPSMYAFLDGDGQSELAYVGRLWGTANVPEHRHDHSWEVIGAIEADGEFVLGGERRTLGRNGVVMVPPGVTHSWTPNRGRPLRAVQVYLPPGPEQRFKKSPRGDAGTPSWWQKGSVRWL